MALPESTEHVLQIFDAVRQAMLTNDADVLRAHVDADYEGSDAAGRLHDKEQMIAAYGPGGVELAVFDVSEVRARSLTDTVLLRGIAHIRGRYGDEEFEHELRFLDVYALRETGWQLVASHVTDLAEPEADDA